MSNPGIMLGMSPDQLLETHSVSEVEVVASQLSKEVDRKREELRVMVGERYRDLIQAADTIHSMRQCTSSVIQSLSSMQGSCEALQRHRLQSDKSAAAEHAGVMSANVPYLAVTASIKLLTILPEQIWSAVEEGEWCEAAELYLLSQHVYIGLQADQGGGVSPDKVKKWFPVISRQWDVLQQLHSSLVSSCQAQLLQEQLGVETAVDCMAALMLLSNQGLKQILTTLLQSRSQCLSAVVRRCRSESAVVGVTGVSVTLLASLNIFTTVITSLTSILRNMSLDNYQPTVTKISSAILGPTAKYLPKPILQFKPHVADEVLGESVDSDSMFRDWIQSSLTLTRSELSSVFHYVDSVESLVRVEQAVNEDIGQEKMELLEQRSLWQVFFMEMVSERMMEIVKTQLEEMLDTAAGEVERMLSGDTELEFVWTDTSTDLGAVWGKGRQEKQGLQMKCWSWSSGVQEIWRTLDISLQRLLERIKSYPDIELQCRHVSAEFVLKMLQSISDMTRDTKYVERVRVLQSFFSLTPTVEYLLSDQLESVKTQFTDRQLEMFRLWLSDEVLKMTGVLAQLTPDSSLQCLAAWDEVNIAEVGESGDQVTSTISVPSSPSLPLMSALLQLSTCVHAHHPTSLPHSTMVTVNTMVLELVLDTYTKLSHQTLPQNFALQLLFDINFVQTLMLSRDDKDKFQSRLSSAVSSLETNIDPFDLSVFSSHLQDRVKSSCVRLVNSVACLVPGDRISIIASYKSVSSDHHNILSVSSVTCSRFQLLPLAPVISRPKTLLTSAPVSLDTSNISSSNSTKSPRFDSKTVQQTAASFMSWFGNN